MIRGICSCGYESDDLFVGVGFAGPESSRGLAICRTCEELVSVPLGATRTRCPDCRRAVRLVEITDEPPGREHVVECPRCGTHACRVMQTGCWD